MKHLLGRIWYPVFADFMYDQLSEILGDGSLDMDDDAFNMALFTDAHTPSATHTLYSGLTGEVANGNGYTTGGVLLGSVVWTRTGNRTKFSSAAAQWTAASFTARYGIIYHVSSSLLICLIDFLTNQVVTNGTFTVTPNAGGWFDNAPA